MTAPALKRVSRVARAPGGKTVKVELLLDGCRVVEARVTGDFFVYPEEALWRLEDSMRGCSTPSCLEESILEASRGAEALGLDWRWLAGLAAGLLEDTCVGGDGETH